jgi:uncharacterized protein YjiS (DUF1127 family)
MARQTLNTAQDRSTALPTMHLGRVKRSYSPTPGHTRKPASNDTNFLRTSRQDGELEAWARRAAAASGFGDTPAGAAAPTVMPDATEAAASARAARSASLWEIIAVVTEALRALARRAISAWRRQRDERATYRALHALDRRTLHDIGLDSSEARSVAAELAGCADRTRVHALMTLRYLSI